MCDLKQNCFITTYYTLYGLKKTAYQVNLNRLDIT